MSGTKVIVNLSYSPIKVDHNGKLSLVEPGDQLTLYGDVSFPDHPFSLPTGDQLISFDPKGLRLISPLTDYQFYSTPLPEDIVCFTFVLNRKHQSVVIERYSDQISERIELPAGRQSYLPVIKGGKGKAGLRILDQQGKLLYNNKGKCKTNMVLEDHAREIAIVPSSQGFPLMIGIIFAVIVLAILYYASKSDSLNPYKLHM